MLAGAPHQTCGLPCQNPASGVQLARGGGGRAAHERDPGVARHDDRPGGAAHACGARRSGVLAVRQSNGGAR